jgi:hypothetical protein
VITIIGPPEAGVHEAETTTGPKEIAMPDPPKRTDNSKFKVAQGYDAGFLEFSNFTTVSQLLNDNDEDLEEGLLMSLSDDNVVPEFLHGVLLRISNPSPAASEANQYTPYKPGATRYLKKPKTNATGFKKILLFGDLEDNKALTFAILESNNDTHNVLFQNKSMADITVGSRFAVKSPLLVGKLKSGSYVIKTDRPLEVLSAPEIPERPLRTSTVGDALRYFVLKKVKIAFKRHDVITAIQTLCNGKQCDRLKSSERPGEKCGCWGQSARPDTMAKNTVLKQDFFFKDSDNVYHEVNNFTSLKYSKLFFDKGQILVERDDLQNDKVFNKLQSVWKQVVNHVNTSGGWTIVGWFKRAAQIEEDKQEGESSIMVEGVKINVSHMFPSEGRGAKIPHEITMKQSDIRILLG